MAERIAGSLTPMFIAALRADPEAGNLRFPVTPPFSDATATASPSRASAVRSRPSASTAKSGIRTTSFAMHQMQVASITKSCRITR